MLEHIFRSLALTTAGAVLSLAVISETHPAQAALFNYSFTVDVSDSLQGTGSFNYDDSAPKTITPSGDALQVSNLAFSWLGKTYSAADDSRLSFTPNLVPTIYLKQGTSEFLNALDYSVTTPDQEFSFIPSSNGVVGSTSFSAFSFSDGAYKTGTVRFTPVPEPSAILGLSFLSLGGLLLKKQRRLLVTKR